MSNRRFHPKSRLAVGVIVEPPSPPTTWKPKIRPNSGLAMLHPDYKGQKLYKMNENEQPSKFMSLKTKQALYKWINACTLHAFALKSSMTISTSQFLIINW